MLLEYILSTWKFHENIDFLLGDGCQGFGTNAPYRIRQLPKSVLFLCNFGASFHQFHWCLNMMDRTPKLSSSGKGYIPTPPHGVSMPQVVVKPSYQWSTCCPEQRHPPTQWEPRYLGWWYCWWIHPGGYQLLIRGKHMPTSTINAIVNKNIWWFMNGWIFFSIHLLNRNLSTLCWDPLGFVLFLVESDDLRGGLEVTLVSISLRRFVRCWFGTKSMPPGK